MAKTATQRRAAADARKRAQGLTRVSVWVPVDYAYRIKAAAERLTRQYGITRD